MASGADQTKMDSLVKKREKYFARLQALYDVGNKCFDLASKKQPYANELESFHSRFQRIEDDYAVFEHINDDITILNSSLEDKDKIEVHNVSMAYDEIYFNVKTLARKMKVDKPQPQNPTPGATQPPPQSPLPAVARLPKLEIEPFDGSISNWPNFYALFHSLIHKNASLTKSEKLTYLRSLLKSHALSLIETLVISEENYDIAMQLLIQRYQNKRLLASNYLDKVFSFRPLSEDSTGSLTSFLEVFNTNIAALKALGITDLFDFTLLHIGLRSLTPSTRKDFESEQTNTDIPTFDTLIKYVEQQLRVLEMTTSSHSKPKPKLLRSPQKLYNPSQRSSMLSTINANTHHTDKRNIPHKCPCCQEATHKIYSCPTFKSLNLAQRNDVVKNQSLCYCCLGFHKAAECKSTSRCFACKGKHHTLLHRQIEAIPETSNNGTSSTKHSSHTQDAVAKTCSLANSSTATNMLLSTALIGVRDRHGSLQSIRALIDSGSQTSLITEPCAIKLGLRKHNNKINLIAIGETTVPYNKGSVSVSISPLDSSSIILNTDAVIVPKISADQPNAPIDLSIRQKLTHLKLADPDFDTTSPIEFLIGSDLFFDILQDSHNLIKGEPSAMATIFGWIIGGRVPSTIPSTESSSLLTCCELIDSSIKRFWEIESVNSTVRPNPDEEAAEISFVQSHFRNASGRYVVSLPIKPNAPPLPDTRDAAKRQLINLESRLKRNPNMYNDYRTFMDDYKNQGHMTICNSPSNYIIPHHCVRKEESSTTKLRTVFNASFKKHDSDSSLNEILYCGPKLQSDIAEIITNFRLHSIVLCADIKQMYRNVLVTDEHRKLQHIFYRTNPTGPIDEYELNVLTYGVTSSAFLAQRVLLQLVKDEGHNYPLASNAIAKQTFVDDICTSVDTPEEALRLQEELIKLLGLGGFTLHKWASNCPQILQKVPLDQREKPLTIHATDDMSMKVLGLQYNSENDTFSYTINLNPIAYSKRAMLSEMSKIYDILGWITPVTFYVKQLMQSIWILGFGWDDPLPNEICSKWSIFISTLPRLSELRIPRYVPVSRNASIQIIGFCDASEKGYAANLYLRSERQDCINVQLIKAKSKVAPLKVLSIPRLELSAAQLLKQLVVSVQNLIDQINPEKIILYSDSSVVLSWLKIPPYKLKTFVANRVVDILDATNPDQWRHIDSKQNPCDVASRGLLPADLLSYDIWWNGPEFLHSPYSNWKPCKQTDTNLSDIPEVKVESLLITQETEASCIIQIMEKCSTLTKAQYVVAYLLRFCNNCLASKTGQSPIKGHLTPKELKDALLLCVKVTQKCYMSKDINLLKNGDMCSPKYRSLAPFLQNGLVRVGGRLQFSNLPYSTKHPLLIPRSSRLASLICDHYHILSLHGGPRLTQSLIQRTYWIVGIRQLLREQIFKCQKCYLFQAKTITPKMSDLPPVRFENIRAFLNIGLDYAGPFQFKDGTRRKSPISKGYIVIFVCLATKAVHLEFATSLSTPTFLAAFDRFVARRGLCQKIYSDCGTNFQGASNHYAEVIRFLKENNNEINQKLYKKGITWLFNPPAAPHFGGIWEAAVKSTKFHLCRILGHLTLTYEEMNTLLHRIEAVLNSRPLGLLSSDPNDGDYLTPGHFIVGSPLITPPELDYTETPMNRLSRYQLLQQAAQAFWKAWSRDYLHTLMPRTKWTASPPNIKEGDVVYLQIKNTSPLEWPLGRVESTYPGRDGTVRAVKIKTPQGTFVRPVHKLISLPPPDENLNKD